MVDGPSHLQLILRLTDGSHKMLQGLTLDSSVAEVYCCVEERLGVNNCEFSLVCRHRTLSVPGASLKTIIPTVEETLMLVINLNGAGRGTPDRDRAKRSKSSTFEEAQQSSVGSRYSLHAALPRNTG